MEEQPQPASRPVPRPAADGLLLDPETGLPCPVTSAPPAPDALLDPIVAAVAAEGRAFVERCDAISALSASVGPEDDRRSGKAGAITEIAMLLSVTDRAAQGMWADAEHLANRRLVRAALLAGRVDLARARIVLTELASVDAEVAEKIERELLEQVLADPASDARIGRRPDLLRAWIARRVLRWDPAGARSRRRRRVREETGVRFSSLGDGLGLAAICGPVDRVLGLMQTLDRMLPPRLTGAGADDRTRGQLMFDTLVGSVRQAADRAGIAPCGIELQLELPVLAEGYRVGPGLAQPEPLGIRLGQEALDAVLSAVAALGGLTGDGGPAPVPARPPERASASEAGDASADPARSAGPARSADSARSADPPGGPSHAGRSAEADWQRPAFGHDLPAEWWLREDPPRDPEDQPVGPETWCASAEPSDGSDEIALHAAWRAAAPDGPPALDLDTDVWRADVDSDRIGHSPDDREPDDREPDAHEPGDHEVAAALPSVAAVPELVGHGPIEPAHVAELLLAAAGTGPIRVRRLLVDEVVGVCAVDSSAIPIDRLAAASLPQPPPPTSSYRPTAAQRRVVAFRDRTCSRPGCGCRAGRCDLDHVRAWPAGQTTVGNLHAACRRDHRHKHRDWTVVRHRDGTETWTSPRGRSYRTPDQSR